ncbi:MAG: YitT family protein [Ruminococcaceae bacterium]|nr:YitT family protein [Oscillospiraceae bacterium]
MKGDFSVKIGDVLRNIFCVILGGSLAAAALDFLLIPAGVAPGGISGLSAAICDVFKIPISVGTMIFILNVPLFVGGYLYIGRNFAVQSLIGTFVFSIMTNIFAPFTGYVTGILYGETAEYDRIICALWGGVILGAGLGFVFKGGATTGGSDIVARIVCKKFNQLSIGQTILICDFVVVFTVAVLYRSFSAAMYSAVAIFVSSKFIDTVEAGVNYARQLTIVTSKPDELSKVILSGVSRGVTKIEALGMYSSSPTNVLICVVYKSQIGKVQKLVSNCDPDAFTIVSDVRNVIGQFDHR